MCINEVFIGRVTRVILFSLGYLLSLEHLLKFLIVESWSTCHGNPEVVLQPTLDREVRAIIIEESDVGCVS